MGSGAGFGSEAAVGEGSLAWSDAVGRGVGASSGATEFAGGPTRLGPESDSATVSVGVESAGALSAEGVVASSELKGAEFSVPPQAAAATAMAKANPAAPLRPQRRPDRFARKFTTLMLSTAP